MRFLICAASVFCFFVNAPSPSRETARLPASDLNTGPVLLWKDLFTAIKSFEKELDRATFDVSNLESTDEFDQVRPRSPFEASVLALRNEVTSQIKQTKKKAKNANNLTSSELNSYFTDLHARLVQWNEHGLIQSFPSTINERLRGMRDAAIALVRHYRLVRDIRAEEENFSSLFPTRTQEVTFKSANHVCAMIAAPGNIILRKALLIDGRTDNDFSDKIMKVIRAIEKLKGADTNLNFRHTELITQIENYNNIETLSYYPWYFMTRKPDEEKKPLFMLMNNRNPEYFSYRSKFAVYRVVEPRFEIGVNTRESALKRIESKYLFNKMGTCADFVNWLFNNTITSPWNQVPIVRRLVNLLYPPEAIQTPDDIADSPQTEKVCEVENSTLIFPQEIDVKNLNNRTQQDLRSKDERVRKHAKNVRNFLIKNGVLTAEGLPEVEKISVHLKQFSGTRNPSVDALTEPGVSLIKPSSPLDDFIQ